MIEMTKFLAICHKEKSETFRNIDGLSEDRENFEGLR